MNLLKMSVDGILVEGSKTALPNPNLDLYQQFIDRGTPLVFIHGTYGDFPGALSVLDDNRAGGRMLVEYLHGKGHTEIAGIFKSDDIQGLQRYEGFISALRDLEMPMDDRHVFWYDTAVKEQLMSSVDALRKMELTLKGCTAVVCYNDEIANRLVTDLVHRGVKIPQDMAVVSFDNSQYSDFSPVTITSLSHGKRNVGRISAELLIRLIHGERCHSENAMWELVEKESS
jgi:GntR family transcriptional regulator of arabinose operon